MLKQRALAILLACALVAPASAQVPDIGGAVGGVLSDPLGQVGGAADDIARGTASELRRARLNALEQLRRRNPRQIDRAPDGAYVIRREVVAIAPTAEALDAARTRGFSVREDVSASELGLRVVVLEAPANISTRRALTLLRELDPEGAYDFNHLYSGSGTGAERGGAKQANNRRGGGGVRIGLIDSGVAADHRAFAGADIQQRGFGGAATVGAHGTAIASLLMGRDGRFHGAAPGASLYVADVYGGRPTGGGATAIIAALNWLVQERVRVINISLVGPSNRALEAAVEAAIARGCTVVAAVGNDGPAAAPLYPAAYPGVVGVTGVDQRNRALPEAARGAHVDFAAPGAQIGAATPEGGYSDVRGTSFAAPIVAGLIAAQSGAADPLTQLATSAQDLGSRGRDRVYGAGLVGADIRDADRGARR